MPCHNCAITFTVFNREQSCAKCGFSFCNKCLREKVIIDEKSKKICSSCSKKLTNTMTSTSVQGFDPPALLLKRLETLENPAKPPITIIKHKGKLSSLKVDLDPEDKKIYERLEKLKEYRKAQNLPSETEIKRRLLLLKGLNEDYLNEKPQSLQPVPKSEQEEIDDLINCYVSETALDRKICEEKKANLEEVEVRLKKLQTSDGPQEQSSPTDMYEAEDDDSVSKRIIKKALAEAKLEKTWEDTKSDSDEDNLSMDVEQEEPELPWCIICNEDASVKCLGCDGSLYCRRCFKQGHEFFEMVDHKTVQVVSEGNSEQD